MLPTGCCDGVRTKVFRLEGYCSQMKVVTGVENWQPWKLH